MQVLLVTHGGLGHALLESAAMIVGASGDVAHAVRFEPGQGSEDLKAAMRATLAGDDGAVLVLTDIPGGTPTRVAAEVVAPRGGAVVAGVNLPMLLEVLLADDDEPSSLASLADRIGREGIVNVTAALLRAPPEPSGGDCT